MSMNSPLVAEKATVSVIMLKVLGALIPAIAVYVYFFGPAILLSITLASVAALATEAAVLYLRRYPLRVYLLDGSALVTAWLLALSIPPMAPWWMVVVGTVFAILVAKHLYGGLGNNLFNPAMVGFAALMISFPAHMTQWPAPEMLAQAHWSFAQQMDFVFGGTLPAGGKFDAVTMATPLDTLKTQLQLDREVADIQTGKIFSIFSGKGTEIIALFYLLGGLFLWQQRIISWHIPLSFLAAMFATAGLLHLYDPSPLRFAAVPSVCRRNHAGGFLHCHRLCHQSHHAAGQADFSVRESACVHTLSAYSAATRMVWPSPCCFSIRQCR